jgi:hypothetical protein
MHAPSLGEPDLAPTAAIFVVAGLVALHVSLRFAVRIAIETIRLLVILAVLTVTIVLGAFAIHGS